jgi:hypothetical protein
MSITQIKDRENEKNKQKARITKGDYADLDFID